jgi:hypothetical protein
MASQIKLDRAASFSIRLPPASQNCSLFVFPQNWWIASLYPLLTEITRQDEGFPGIAAKIPYGIVSNISRFLSSLSNILQAVSLMMTARSHRPFTLEPSNCKGG